MSSQPKAPLKSLGIFTLAMINVAAIASLKNLPLMAEYGVTLIFVISFAAVLFFIPSALVSAELATGWPKKGGIYIWVREAFGIKLGFLAIWLQWIENVIWYPTILSFTAGTIAFVINPALAENKLFVLLVILVAFWGSTLINFLGMKASGVISSVGVVTGTIVPGLLIIGLGIAWLIQGNASQVQWSWSAAFPDFSKISTLVLLTGMFLSLAGMEMSAVHAQEVKNPQKDYPRAILLAVIMILAVSVLGALSIAIVVPSQNISLVAGVMEAFSYFFNSWHLGWMTPLIAVLITIGAMSMVITWIIGPSKGILATAEDECLPKIFQSKNQQGVPVVILVLQAVLVSALALVILFLPSVSSSYWLLTDLTAQLYLIMYVLMFAAAIRLRWSAPEVKRSYRIPGGKPGIIIVAGMGLAASLGAIGLGFIPPSQIQTGTFWQYDLFLIAGILILGLGPLVYLYFKKSTNRI